jgi:hypothetical protein
VSIVKVEKISAAGEYHLRNDALTYARRLPVFGHQTISAA